MLPWCFFQILTTIIFQDGAATPVPDAPELLADFFFEGGDTDEDHFRLGVAMGAKYSDAVRARTAANLKDLLPFLGTKRGRSVYEQLLVNHRRLVPQLVRELDGIAQGSNISFETIFANSLKMELGYYSDSPHSRMEDHCSDYLFCDSVRCVGGHNEDSSLQDHKLFVGSVRLGRNNFTVINYVGDLAGGMAGGAFNAAGLAFSLNFVGPPTATADGLGRNFISRLLLEARNLDEAIAVVARKHITGHNYQLFDFTTRRMVNVEVANDVYAVRPISNPFFHVNQYRTLTVPNQTITESSAHRTARFTELPAPQTSDDILKLLGDQSDRQYPVFHDQHSHNLGELSDWTLATVLFDLDACTISLMRGNPANLTVLQRFTVTRCSGRRNAIMI